MKVIILSGLPGSGKSHYTKNMKDCSIVSADYFFMEDGVYNFKPELIGEAHLDCCKNYVGCIMEDLEVIVVDNTNLSAVEIAPYYLMGQAFGYEVEVHRINCDWKEAFNRQTHGVPDSVFEGMVKEFKARDVMPWWTVKEIIN